MWIWFVIAGIVSGVVAGMGMGGGTLLIPILTLLLNIAQKNAQSLNLLVFIPTAIIALIIHYKNKLVVTKVGLLIVASGVISSVFGAWLAAVTNNESLRKYFGVFLLFIGVFQFVDSIIQTVSKSKLNKNSLIKSGMQCFFCDKKIKCKK